MHTHKARRFHRTPDVSKVILCIRHDNPEHTQKQKGGETEISFWFQAEDRPTRKNTRSNTFTYQLYGSQVPLYHFLSINSGAIVGDDDGMDDGMDDVEGAADIEGAAETEGALENDGETEGNEDHEGEAEGAGDSEGLADDDGDSEGKCEEGAAVGL